MKSLLKNIRIYLFLSGVFLMQFSFASQIQLKNWKIYPASISEEFIARTGGKEYVEGKVPGTIMGNLVNAGLFPDIFLDSNLAGVPQHLFDQPWIYETEFVVENPDTFHYQLIFYGINYRADIYLNKQLMGNHSEIVNPFRIYRLVVDNAIRKGRNILKVIVYPPRKGEFSIGFVDWNPRPPDKNMGLWRPVALKKIRHVEIVYPRMDYEFLNDDLSEVVLHPSIVLKNHDLDEQQVKLRFSIDNIQCEKVISLNPRETKEFHLSTDEFPQLRLKNPGLWWPHTMGEPFLHPVNIQVLVEKQVSDSTSFHIGLRKIETGLNEKGFRYFKINNKPIQIRGAGWVDDIFLNEDSLKLEHQFQYIRDLGLNTIRLEGFWGSSDLLYSLADRYGVMIMVGWSCEWEWNAYYGGPEGEYMGILSPADMDLMTKAYRDQVRWLRNHPSIFLWVFGSDKLVHPDYENRLIRMLSKEAPDRPFLASCSNRESQISGPTGVRMNGPYDYVTPNFWYEFKISGAPIGAFGFNTEIGPGPQPPIPESLKKMLSEKYFWPINDMWNFHCGRNAFGSLDWYLHFFRKRYGWFDQLPDFLNAAQLANYEAMRAMFEAFRINQPDATGVILWMLNSAWPEMYWQLYDYYLIPNAAYFATKKANTNVHIAYNYGNRIVYALNDSQNELKNIRYDIKLYDIHSRLLNNFRGTIGRLNAGSKAVCVSIPELTVPDSLYFMFANLYHESGRLLSSNFYWLSTKPDELDINDPTWYAKKNKKYASYKAIKNMRDAVVELDSYRIKMKKNRTHIVLHLKNRGEIIALPVELCLIDDRGEVIVPVFWEDNYMAFLPGETRTIKVVLPEFWQKEEKVKLKIRGLNMVMREYNLETSK